MPVFCLFSFPEERGREVQLRFEGGERERKSREERRKRERKFGEREEENTFFRFARNLAPSRLRSKGSCGPCCGRAPLSARSEEGQGERAPIVPLLAWEQQSRKRGARSGKKKNVHSTGDDDGNGNGRRRRFHLRPPPPDPFLARRRPRARRGPPQGLRLRPHRASVRRDDAEREEGRRQRRQR